jgi:hypothetical protein
LTRFWEEGWREKEVFGAKTKKKGLGFCSAKVSCRQNARAISLSLSLSLSLSRITFSLSLSPVSSVILFVASERTMCSGS